MKKSNEFNQRIVLIQKRLRRKRIIMEAREEMILSKWDKMVFNVG